MAPGCFATPSQELNESESRPTGSETLAKNLIIFTGDEKINLEEIPLPAEPAPPLSQIVLLNHQLNKHQIDSFEVLEQTIMKQKRLARLKNTDLRRKILLKRTFDLVCEIMDYENGFEADSPSSSDFDQEIKLDSEQAGKDSVCFELSEVDEESKAQAEVPKKRRASHSDSDEEDYSDDESGDFALKEQQLDSVSSSLDSLHAQLNLYCENRKKSHRKKRRLCDKLGAKSLSIALKA